jgi:hypothetical protein
MTKTHDKSPLLELLNARGVWNYPDYRLPDVNPKHRDEAIRLHSLANDSDPFAASRMRLHIMAGFALPSEVAHDAKGLLQRRQGEAHTQFASETLASVKKRLEADRAWNQHRTAKFIEARQ